MSVITGAPQKSLLFRFKIFKFHTASSVNEILAIMHLPVQMALSSDHKLIIFDQMNLVIGNIKSQSQLGFMAFLYRNVTGKTQIFVLMSFESKHEKRKKF